MITLTQETAQHFIFARHRYYGGIKLGAGGLIRAYGGSARNALQVAVDNQDEYCTLHIPTQVVQVIVPLAQSAVVYRLVELYAGKISMLHDHAFDLAAGQSDGEEDVQRESFLCEVPETKVKTFQLTLQDACKGQARITLVES